MIEKLKAALEALETGEYAAREVAAGVHTALAGYKPEKHAGVDADVAQIESAAQGLRTVIAQLEASEPVIGTKTWMEDGKVVTQNLTAKDIYKEPEQESVELYLEQALEYVQMVERNVTTDPRYMSHQAEQRIQSALNIVRNEGFKSTFAEVAKHADLVARVKRAEVAQDRLRKVAKQALHWIETVNMPGRIDVANALRKEIGA